MSFLLRVSSFLVVCFIASISFALEGPSLTQCPLAQAPQEENLRSLVKEAHACFKDVNEGENFKGILALAKVDPRLFGVAIVTVKGEVYVAGDSEYAFAIESISKPFTLARVMQDHGEEAIVEKIGVEPTGLPFNSVTAVEVQKSKRDRPAGNPLVNAGAMAAVSLVKATSAAERWEKIARDYDTFAGAKLSVNQEVYQSEAETNHRNRGIAELLFSYERLYADPLETADVYTKQCSVGVTTTQLATMGATLANGGVNPFTGERAVDAKFVPKILAVMMMAGLYDGAGSWAWRTGLPAKTGVGGGIVAVVPGKFAIAAFSPPLDQFGNSVRGVRAIQYISKELGLNLFDARR
mgnify:CR=1 FL=1